MGEVRQGLGTMAAPAELVAAMTAPGLAATRIHRRRERRSALPARRCGANYPMGVGNRVVAWRGLLCGCVAAVRREPRICRCSTGFGLPGSGCLLLGCGPECSSLPAHARVMSGGG